MESGSKFGHYEILAVLGKAGMGELWRARDRKLGRELPYILTIRDPQVSIVTFSLPSSGKLLAKCGMK